MSGWLKLLIALGAAAAAPAWADAQAALQAARERYPATQVHAAEPTAVPGLYQFDMGGQTVYGDVTARYLLFGSLFDMQEPAASVYAQVKSAAFELQPGQAGEVIVFSDPLCPYCAELERRIIAGELAGYRVGMVLVPLQPGSRQLSAAVLCRPDPAAAWRALIVGGTRPKQCATDKLEPHLLAARQAGVSATPALLVPSGELLVGLPARGQLASWAARGQR